MKYFLSLLIELCPMGAKDLSFFDKSGFSRSGQKSTVAEWWRPTETRIYTWPCTTNILVLLKSYKHTYWVSLSRDILKELISTVFYFNQMEPNLNCLPLLSGISHFTWSLHRNSDSLLFTIVLCLVGTLQMPCDFIFGLSLFFFFPICLLH